MKCCHFLVYQRKNIKFVGTTLYHDGIEYFILEYLTFINNYRIRRWRVLVFLFIIISVMYTYVIWSSWISHLSAILILRYSPSKETTSFGSYCFSKPTFTNISESTCPILMGFSAKWSLCNVLHDYVENSKLNFTDFRLILFDHITYAGYIACIWRSHYSMSDNVHICWVVCRISYCSISSYVHICFVLLYTWYPITAYHVMYAYVT